MRYLLIALCFLSCQARAESSFDADFAESTGLKRLGSDFVCGHSQDKVRYELYQQIWEKNRPGLIKAEQPPKIPKIIHQIWLEESPIPKKYKKNQQSWIDHHPDWKYKLWTIKDLEVLPAPLGDYIKQTESLQEKEDLLRIYLLRAVGGTVIDIAFQNIVPLDDLHCRYDFYTAMEQPLAKARFNRRLHVGTSFIGACPQHPIVSSWWEQVLLLISTATHDDPIIQKAIRRPEKRERLVYLLFGLAVDLKLDSQQYINIVFPPTYAYPLRAKWAHDVEKRERKPNPVSLKSLIWSKMNERVPPLFSTLQPETVAWHTKGGTWVDTKQVKIREN